MARDSPLAGHLGIKKTYRRIIQYFYWPKLKRDETEYCRSWRMTTRMTSGRKAKPDYKEPFSRVIIDYVCPFRKRMQVTNIFF